jgi:hypothetical protein
MNKMPSDPVIEEIREVRHRISARFGHDPERLFEHYLEVQKEYRDRLVDRPQAQDQLAEDPVGRTQG